MAKTALITGASSGIGLELSRIFASRKNNLVLVARNKSKLDELKVELEMRHKISVCVIAKDLSQLNSAREVYDETSRQNIQIDYLVNNAGFGDFGFFYESNWEKQQEMINVNITALTHLSRLYLPSMVKRGSGRMMNLGSTASFQPGPMMSVYYATKAYVLFFSEAINNEVKDKGVTVTALCPGPTESGFQTAAANKESRLVKGRKLPSSKEVAEYGYKAMMKGKAVAIHGFMNNIMANSVRFAPRSWVVKIARYLTDKKAS
jgi:uncharacterized protein